MSSQCKSDMFSDEDSRASTVTRLVARASLHCGDDVGQAVCSFAPLPAAISLGDRDLCLSRPQFLHPPASHSPHPKQLLRGSMDPFGGPSNWKRFGRHSVTA